MEYPIFIGGTEVGSLNKFIEDIINENLSSDKALVDQWLKDEKQGIGVDGGDLTEVLCTGPEEYHMFCSVNLYSSFTVSSIINDIVSLELVITDYTGGGNGNHSSSITINYDLKSNKELNVSELFCSSDYANTLFQIAEIDLGNQYPYLGYEKIFDDNLPKADNFKNVLLNDFGITLVFQPYHVTAGADGIARVLVPYSEINNLVCLP